MPPCMVGAVNKDNTILIGREGVMVSWALFIVLVKV